MRKIIIGVSIIVWLNLLSMNIFAADHYIRAGASGRNDGNDWTNAYPSLPGTYARGDTYYIASGTYDGNWVINSTESGSTWTYIKKATVAGHGTGTGWDDSYATGQAVINGSLAVIDSYIEIDGVTGSGNSGHGIKVNHSTCANSGNVIYLERGKSHIHLHHIEAVGSGFSYGATGCDGLYQNNVETATGDVHVSFSWIHEVTRNGVTLGNHQGTGWSDASLGFLFENNRLERTGGCTDPNIHGQGVQAGYITTQSYHVYRNNVFIDILGSANIAYLDNTTNSNILIYNNIFASTNRPTYWSSPGVIWSHNLGVTMTGMGIYNNTFYNLRLAQIQIWPTGSNESKNNLWINCDLTGGHTGVLSQNNAYYGNVGDGVPSGEHRETGQQDETSMPVVDAAAFDFRLVAGAKSVNTGVSLSSYFTTDIVGTSRPQGIAWDIGAYEGASESMVKTGGGGGCSISKVGETDRGSLIGIILMMLSPLIVLAARKAVIKG
jgi:hypothetical protein